MSRAIRCAIYTRKSSEEGLERDKIAASKAKGMWMGGNLPLGYDPPSGTSRALVVNPAEAESVRLIFRRYLELGSVSALQDWLEGEGIRSKAYLSSRGRKSVALRSVGARSSTSSKNRIYLGEMQNCPNSLLLSLLPGKLN